MSLWNSVDELAGKLFWALPLVFLGGGMVYDRKLEGLAYTGISFISLLSYQAVRDGIKGKRMKLEEEQKRAAEAEQKRVLGEESRREAEDLAKSNTQLREILDEIERANIDSCSQLYSAPPERRE